MSTIFTDYPWWTYAYGTDPPSSELPGKPTPIDQLKKVRHINFFSDCGGNLTGNGTILSPNFPEEYNNMQTCIWQIEAMSGSQILLQFEAFDVSNMSLINRKSFHHCIKG